MVSNSTFSLALFVLLTLLFFTFATACGTCPTPKPKPKPNPKPPCPSSPSVPSSPSAPSVPSSPSAPSVPFVPSGPAVPSAPVSCPRDALKLGVCADLLGGLINISIGTPPVTPCCSLIQGLADLEAAVCLCTAIKANILGINLNIPLSLSLLLNVCSINPPPGFQCA